MACNIDSTLEQPLKCPICHGRIQDAKFLECGHSFCKECIGKLIRLKLQLNQRVMECPSCRRVTIIDCNTINNLKSNWLANSVVEAIDSTQTNSPHPLSHMCDINFTHRERPWTREIMADQATGKMMDLIHRSDEWCVEHTQQLSIIQDIKSEGNQVLDKIRNDVLLSFEGRRNQLALAKERLLCRIDELKIPFNGTVDTLLEKEQVGIARVSQACIMAQRNLNMGNMRDISSSYNDWAAQLEVDLSREVGECVHAKQKLETLKTMQYQSFLSPEEFLDMGFIGARE